MSKIRVCFKKHELQFKFDAGTSRGVLRTKATYFILIKNNERLLGLGEAAPLFGLSIDNPLQFEEVLQAACNQLETTIQEGPSEISISSIVPETFPAIRFGIEMAWKDYLSNKTCVYFDNDFVKGSAGIPINGLIWMSDKQTMLQQIKEKLKAGYTCIKLKIGAINFKDECELMAFIRREFTPEDVTLRVDANGAFAVDEALEKLKRLSDFHLHSIEQPIAVGNTEQMRSLCEHSPLAIALDEELIGVFGIERQKLLSEIRPQYIILKPSLLGGFEATDRWIEVAKDLHIGWWITSALEANVGLNAIAQYTYQLSAESYQGLGTGQLYHNNLLSPLLIKGGYLYHNPKINWDFSLINS